MKKLLSCILVLALFLSLSLAGGWSGKALADTPQDRVGTYELTGLIMDGEDYSELIKTAMLEASLIVNADGTAVLVMDGEDLALTWNDKNFMADDGIPVTYTFEDGVLVLIENDMTMTFTKVDEAAGPAERSGEPQDIAGLWVGTVDLVDFVAEADGDLAPFLTSLPMAVVMEMREDGTYTISLDTALVIPPLRESLYAYVGDLCVQNGITVAQLEESYGESLDKVIEDAIQDMDLSKGNQTVNGVYEESGGKVIWDKGPNETVGLYTGDTLVFTIPDFGEVLLTRGTVVGTWISTVDLMEVLGEENDEMGQYFSGLQVDLILDIRSDGTFTLSLDGESMIPGMKRGMRAYLEAYMEENGITAEQLESITGQSVDDLISEAIAEMDTEDLNKSLSGTYTEENGQIVLTSENEKNDKGSWSGSKLDMEVEDYGKVSFIRASNEDYLAKGEGVMSYAEFAAAELDSPVVIEAYVQGHQSWWNDAVTVYAQDADGGYFIYNMACSEEDAALLVPGQKIRVTGYKSEWSGEVEIVDASFEFVLGSYIFRPVNVTSLLDKDELVEFQNQKVSFKGMTVEPYDASGAAFAYKDPDGKTDDLYFKVSKDGKTYEFCVEFYLCGKDTAVYKAVEALNVGDVVDLEGFLYWYNGANPHITSVTVR